PRTGCAGRLARTHLRALLPPARCQRARGWRRPGAGTGAHDRPAPWRQRALRGTRRGRCALRDRAAVGLKTPKKNRPCGPVVHVWHLSGTLIDQCRSSFRLCLLGPPRYTVPWHCSEWPYCRPCTKAAHRELPSSGTRNARYPASLWLRSANMPHSEALAAAAHLHVLLRRKTGRVTDTEWMASNVEYARAMVAFARACAE